jgi:formiminoglutamase
MSQIQPVSIVIPETAPDDPRVGHLLGSSLKDSSEARVVIVGFPVHEGVRRNGGRVGAAEGPVAIRQAFFRLTPDPQNFDAFVELLRQSIDLGDFVATGDLEANQAGLGEVLAPHLQRGAIAIALGGGHETSFGHFLGYVGANQSIGIVNWDAHPDVRPLRDGLGHSGSPFRQILEHPSGLCRSYLVAGLNASVVAKAHLDYLSARRAECVFSDVLDRNRIDAIYAGCQEPSFSTFDLDAVSGTEAPGVSAPATNGMASDLWLHAAECAGRCRHIRSIDVVELNPRFDVDGRTARLAASTIWHFLRGLCHR